MVSICVHEWQHSVTHCKFDQVRKLFSWKMFVLCKFLTLQHQKDQVKLTFQFLWNYFVYVVDVTFAEGDGIMNYYSYLHLHHLQV